MITSWAGPSLLERPKAALHLSWRYLVSPLSTISGLLFGGSPSTVAGLIVAIVVDAIQGLPLWARPHVLKERFKAVLPALADANAPSAPERELRRVRVETAILHRLPRPIGLATASFAGKSMLQLSGDHHLAMDAAAT